MQSYLDDNNPQIETKKRLSWCPQAAEAVLHVHKCGVLHSDLRPGNFLIHAPGSGALELLLCDFGGSVCEDLGLDGLALPSISFYHPALGNESSIALDILSLGSILYVILTGHWPYRDTPGRPREPKEREKY